MELQTNDTLFKKSSYILVDDFALQASHLLPVVCTPEYVAKRKMFLMLPNGTLSPQASKPFLSIISQLVNCPN